MFATARLLGVLDVGKTHSRLRLIDAESDTEVWRQQRENQSIDAAIGRQLDIADIERWLMEALSAAPRRSEIGAIIPIAHGAAAVLIGENDEILAAPDYEDPRFERLNAEYERERDAFDVSGSPSLPLGLNLGRQLFYFERYQPELFRRTKIILPYTQFWAWRLCGVMASELTTLGCHSDLWCPADADFSQLARRHGWADRFAPLRFAGDSLGVIPPALAAASGLSTKCMVQCGIHDSNASYLRHLLSRRDERFAVVSSGTWTVVLANRTNLSRLHERRDMLANVDVFGSAVGTARFMGGREYEAIAKTTARPDIGALRSVLAKKAMALPPFAPGGPFAGRRPQLIQADMLGEAERAALATLYVGLMTDYALDLLGADGEVIVDGPLASNPLFAPLLATLRSGSHVCRDESQRAGQAIAFLGGLNTTVAHALQAESVLELEGLEAYRRKWRERAESRELQ